jgi:hypothetical protein
MARLFSRRAAWSIPILAALINAGCDGSSAYRAALRDQTKALEDLQAILARITDKDSMLAARAQLTARFDEFERIGRRNQEIERPTPETMRELHVDGEKVRQALKKVHEQVRRIQTLPEGAQFLESFEYMKGLVINKAP